MSLDRYDISFFQASLATLLLCAPLQLVGQPMKAPVANVLDAEGGTTVIRSGKPTTLGILDNLFSGDIVTTDKKGSLILAHSRTQLELRLAPASRAEVTESGWRMQSGPEPVTKKLGGAALGVLTPTDDQRRIAGAVRMRSIQVARPVPAEGERVIMRSPTMSWNAASAPGPYRLILTSDEKTILDTTTDVPGLTLDLKAPLSWGQRYEWRVFGSTLPDKILVKASFTLISEEDSSRLAELKPANDNDIAALVIYGLALHNLRASGAANAVWATVAKRRPALNTPDATK